MKKKKKKTRGEILKVKNCQDQTKIAPKIKNVKIPNKPCWCEGAGHRGAV